MVRYPIDDVKEGMVLGESVYHNYQLLIASGFRLQPNHIEQLRKKGYTSLLIDVKGTEQILPETIINQHVENELHVSVDNSEKTMKELFERAKKEKREFQDLIKKDKKFLNTIIQNSGAHEVINKVIDDITTEPWSMVNLTKMREHSNSLYAHSITVTIISLCIGHKYGFSNEELRQLGLGAINYDIGLLAIPQAIMEKNGTLTPEEKRVLQQHTVYGYMMLSDNTLIPPTSSIIALSHHEQQDGNGYPRKLKGENKAPIKSFGKTGLIHRFAEIVAVADAYDMLVNGRKHFSPKLEPQKAIRTLLEMRGPILNAEIFKMLLTILPLYPVGTRVRILQSPFPGLDGHYAVIAKVFPERLLSPEIIVIESKNKIKLPKPITIDMSKHKGFVIELA